MAEPADSQTFVFAKSAVMRSIRRLEDCQIHEHFAGYLAVLRAVASHGGVPVRMAAITEFHDRYLRVVGAPEQAPYVRPFKSRGHGLETFNANVAGSYAPSSLRSQGRLIEVIEVLGERKNATYGLREEHGKQALEQLLTTKVPVGALATFLYRDYGLHLEKPDVGLVVDVFREEFGLSSKSLSTRRVFSLLFEDDTSEFSSADFQIQAKLGRADE